MTKTTNPARAIVVPLLIAAFALAAASGLAQAGKLISEHGPRLTTKGVPLCGKMGLVCPKGNPPLDTKLPSGPGPTHLYCYGARPTCPAGQAPFCVSSQFGGHHVGLGHWHCVNDHRN